LDSDWKSFGREATGTEAAGLPVPESTSRTSSSQSNLANLTPAISVGVATSKGGTCIVGQYQVFVLFEERLENRARLTHGPTAKTVIVTVFLIHSSVRAACAAPISSTLNNRTRRAATASGKDMDVTPIAPNSVAR
jgi:hypothetical protein